MLRNIILSTILVLGGASFAQAETSAHNVVGKAHYQGQSLVRLKQLTNQKLNALGEDASSFKLVGVSMLAKSRHGNGQATLIVGHDQSTKSVGKNGGKLVFKIKAPWTFKTLNWDISNNPGMANERWQMRFNGNIKVRHITVHVASRTKRIRIPMGGAVLKGQSTIYVKRELRDLGYNMKGKKLRKVVLVAKSRQGNGKAKLQIGQKMKPQKPVFASKSGGFQTNQSTSFNRIKWRANGPTKGAWQIHTRGRIKVKAVIVEVQ